MNSVKTAVLEEHGEFVFAKLPSIALIAPNEPRRSAVSSVLSDYPEMDMREFSSYPTDLHTAAKLLARQFDVVFVDLDSDPKVALDLVESIRNETAITVIVYTEEADPDRMARCMRAGARDYLVLPIRQCTLDKVFARAKIGLSSDAQPAPRPRPQLVATPKADGPRSNPSPAAEPVRVEDEGVLPPSRSNGAAKDRQPALGSREPDREFDEVSSSPPRPDRVVVEEIPYATESKPSTAGTKDEDFLKMLRAIGTAYTSQSPTAPEKSPSLRPTHEATWVPSFSSGGVKRREILESDEETPTQTGNEVGALRFHSDLDDLGGEDDDDLKRRKLVKIGAASFVVLVLLIFIGPRLLSPTKHTVTAQAAETHRAAGDYDPLADVPDSSAKPAEKHTSATARTPHTSMAQPAANVEEAISPKADLPRGTILAPRDTRSASPQVDSTLMNDQLASAPRIPQDVKTVHKDVEAPPPAGFDAANTEGLGSGAGAVGSAFSGQSRPSVRYVPPPPVVVPNEVAEKLLIHKSLPAFPAAAYKHFVYGKVVLEAIISETGSVESLKFVSGSPEFLQASLDAVKTWRYRPYVVNNKPARVQTTVTLIFDPYKQ